jgi:ABC-2 type transport system permease protein
VAERLTTYRALVGSRVRSQTAYRRSFALDLLAGLGVTLIGLAEIYIIFTNVPALGGVDFAGAVLIFALAHTAFYFADLLVGHLDTLPAYVRAGTLDTFLLRPLPVLAQLVTSDIALRRLGRIVTGLVLFGVALVHNDIAWTPATITLLTIAIGSGTAIFAALFICAGALQFWLVEGGEIASALTYGSSYASQFPGGVFTAPVRILFTFVLPATFVAYLPVVVLLDLPAPAGLPRWLGWCTPLAAAASWAVALAMWRSGLRRYTGTGS